MDIKLLNKKLLIDFISHEEYNALEFVPITKHRALSQVKNPRADDNDVLLLLAYQEKKIVGYLGVLPDKIYLNNEFEKCGWLSSYWVHPAHRGKQIAKQLLDKCLEVWEKRILVADFTSESTKLYDNTRLFNALQQKKGIRLYIRSDLSTLLPPKNKIFSKLSPVLNVLDAMINSLLDIRLSFEKTKINNFQMEYVNQIGKETEEFIADKQQGQLFKRQADDLNWMIKNPWVLSAPKKDLANSKYYFSSTEEYFEYYPLKIKNKKNELVAFIIFSKRNQSLKMPYCYYNDGNLKIVTDIVSFHILKWNIKTFSTFHTEISEHLSNNSTPALLKKYITRNYIISNEFSSTVPYDKFQIQDGDADCGFT